MKNVNNIINSAVYNTTINDDITTSLIDKTLIDSASVMYTRQAVYYYLLKLNGFKVTDLRKAIMQRAKIQDININRGVLVRESDVANICLVEKSAIFAKVKINKRTPAESIAKIAKLMSDNKLSFTYLQKEGFFKKKEKQADSTESTQDKKQDVTLTQVLMYIKNADAKHLERIAFAIKTAQAAQTKAQAKSKKKAA